MEPGRRRPAVLAVPLLTVLLTGVALLLSSCGGGAKEDPPATTPDGPGTPPGAEAPEVERVTPADQAEGVDYETEITVTFSAAMDEPATEAAFAVTPGVDCDFSWNEAATRLTCTPTTTLTENTEYTISVGSGAESRSGAALASAWTSRFTTGAGPVSSCVLGTGVFGSCTFGP